MNALPARQISAQEVNEKPSERLGRDESDEADDEELIQSVDGPLPKLQRTAVSISGRALNGQGLPVADATVFVVPSFPLGVPYRHGDDRPLAKGNTDEQGKYNFDDVKLFVYDYSNQVVPKPPEGSFQIFAIAPEKWGYAQKRMTMACTKSAGYRKTRALRVELNTFPTASRSSRWLVLEVEPN